MQRIVRFFIERRPFLLPLPIALSFLLGLLVRPLLFFNTTLISLIALSCNRKEVSRAIAGSLVVVAFFSFLLSLDLVASVCVGIVAGGYCSWLQKNIVIFIIHFYL